MAAQLDERDNNKNVSRWPLQWDNRLALFLVLIILLGGGKSMLQNMQRIDSTTPTYVADHQAILNNQDPSISAHEKNDRLINSSTKEIRNADSAVNNILAQSQSEVNINNVEQKSLSATEGVFNNDGSNDLSVPLQANDNVNTQSGGLNSLSEKDIDHYIDAKIDATAIPGSQESKPEINAVLAENRQHEITSIETGRFYVKNATLSLSPLQIKENPTVSDPNVRPIITPRSGLGVYVSTELYPYTDPDIMHLRGFSVGISYDRAISTNFYFETGLGLRSLRGNFGSTDESVQTVFNGFGWTRDFHSFKPHASYYLEMPLLLSYEIGQSRFGTGVRLSKLIAIRADHVIQEYDQEQLLHQDRSQVTPLETRSNTTWVNSAAFNDVRADAVINYSLFLSNRFAFTLEGRYAINGILRSGDDQELLRESGSFLGSVRLNMKL